MRRLILLAVLTTVLLGASAGGASATTWSGTCHVEGKIVVLDSPLTFLVEDHEFETPGKGSCEGTLNGAPYSGPVSYDMAAGMNAPLSCAVGVSTGAPATLTFGGNPRAVDATWIDVVVDHVNVSSQAPLAVTGAYNGYGWAHLRFLGGQAAVEQCAGPGISEVDYEVDMQTVTPLHG